MNFIKELIADSLNGFVLTDIPFMVFRIFVAGAIGYVLALILSKKEKGAPLSLNFPGLSMFMALLSICVMYSVPLAILCLPLLLLLKPDVSDKSQYYRMMLVFALGAGIACGAGKVFVTLLGMVLISPFILLYKPKN